MLCTNVRIFKQFQEAINPNITQREIKAMDGFKHMSID